jgi:putative transposase
MGCEKWRPADQPSKIMVRAFKYRLLPTEEQKNTLTQWFGVNRFIWNLGLQTKIAAWTSQRKNVTAYDLMKQLTELKHTDAPWLSECPRISLEYTLNTLESAYKGFFKGMGFPNFKKRSNRQSIFFRQSLAVSDTAVRIPKLGEVSYIKHRPMSDGELRSFTISKTPAGGYFVSILVKDDSVIPEKKPIIESSAVGVDLGIKAFATLSDGVEIENPKYLHQQLRRLRVEQRTLARRYKKGVPTDQQSKGWHKQKLIVAKLHEKISNQRSDFLHKASDLITKNYDTVVMEDLNVRGMMQNRKLSKAISDVSWSEFNRMLEYKAEWRGKNIKRIGRFEPSSKICSSCGNIFKELKLSDRVWTCEICGTEHERDQNAAKNIKNFGLNVQPSLVNVVH